jgi:hypothetical protein
MAVVLYRGAAPRARLGTARLRTSPVGHRQRQRQRQRQRRQRQRQLALGAAQLGAARPGRHRCSAKAAARSGASDQAPNFRRADMTLDATALFSGLLLSSIGLGLLVFGKRQQRAPQWLAGLLLMVLPLVPSPLWVQWLAAAGLVGGVVWATRAGC